MRGHQVREAGPRSRAQELHAWPKNPEGTPAVSWMDTNIISILQTFPSFVSIAASPVLSTEGLLDVFERSKPSDIIQDNEYSHHHSFPAPHTGLNDLNLLDFTPQGCCLRRRDHGMPTTPASLPGLSSKLQNSPARWPSPASASPSVKWS